MFKRRGDFIEISEIKKEVNASLNGHWQQWVITNKSHFDEYEVKWGPVEVDYDVFKAEVFNQAQNFIGEIGNIDEKFVSTYSLKYIKDNII